MCIGVTQMWGDSYEIAFKSTSGSDGSQAQTTIANLISSGSSYVSSVSATKCYNGKSGYGIKMGASSGSSSIVLNLSSEGQVKPTKVKINACRYGSDTGNMNVTLNDGSATTKTLTSSLADYECAMDGNTTLSKITIAPTTKRIYVTSIIVEYGSAKTLSSIEVSGNPTKTTYEAGDAFDVAGLTVLGHYSDNTQQAIPSGMTWEVRTNSTSDAVALANYTLTQGQTSLQVRATVDEISSDWHDVTGLTVNEHTVTPGKYTVTLNNALFGSNANGSLSGDALHDYTGQQNDITFNYVKGSGSSMYMNDSQIRLYKNVTLVVSVPAGYNITKVESLVANIAANVGSISSNTWTGKSNSITFSFTQSSGNAQLGTISVTYAAIAPEVTVDPSSLSFTAKQNYEVAGKTFTLEGANLTSGLTLAASAGYSVSPTSISAADAMAQGGAEVTVTPATPTTTTTPVEGTVTISGGGLASNVVVNLSMAVTPTYLVALAVNDGDMGSATLNGGTASIYVTDDEEIALVATPESGHEFVNWTVSDENIVLDDENAASTTALAAAAGTITANFQAQACTGLAAPVLDEVTTTYQSATIAWEAVANADGYVLNLKKHEGNVAVVTDELIVAPTVSFEKTGLAANTQYDYTVMAVGDGASYCDESNPLLEGNFTTNDYPAATLTLSEVGAENDYTWGSSLKLNSEIALPSSLQHSEGCSGKVLVGWSSVAIAEPGDKPTANYWEAGADYTMLSTADKLYAVYATGSAAGDVEKLNEDFSGITSGNSTSTNGSSSAWTPNSNFSSTKNNVYQAGGAIRLGKSGSLITKALDLSSGAVTVSFKLKGWASGEKTITVQVDDQTAQSTTCTGYIGSGDFESKSLTFAAGTSSSVVKFTTSNSVRVFVDDIVVSVAAEASYSEYTTACEAALPVLDAPTFVTEEGVFYVDSKNITISAAEGASIYYTINGDDPTSESTLYDAENGITLNAYGSYTIKAIAIQAGHENSDVAEATYAIGKIFASVSDLYSYLEAESPTSMNNVKVTGLVSRVTTAWDAQKGYLTYYISDNGQAENDLQMYHGAGTGADVLAVGDQVTVTGNYVLYNSSIHEFAAGNTIVARTAATIASVAIGGAAEKTTYSPEDNVFSHAGLTATATYNTGYTKDVTADATWTNNLTENIVAATGKVEVTATYEGKNDMKEVDVIYSSKTLDKITLSYASITVYEGATLPTPTVTASYVEEIAPEDVTELVAAAEGFDTEKAYNGSAAGTYTINVSYTLGTVTKNAEYTVTVVAIYNNEGAPHEASVAKAIIEARENNDESGANEIMWVHGIVSQASNASSNKQNYYISDDGETTNQLYVYQGQYFSTTPNFTTSNQLKVGDEVVVKGKVQLYKNNQNVLTAELKSTNVVSQFRAPEFAFADIVAGDEFEVNISEDLAVVPTKNTGDAEFTLSSGNTDAVTIVNGKLHAVAEGDAVITAHRAETANENALNYNEATATFNVHVIAERDRYTVSFDKNGGEGSDPEAIAAQLAGATVNLPATCPYTKASSAFAGWVVNDGAVEITDGHFTMPAAAVTIKATWNTVGTCAISFRVSGSEVATADAPQTAEFSLAGVSHPTVEGFEFVGWSEDEYAEEVTALPTTINIYTPALNEESKTLYGIYSQVVGSESNLHYVLDYADENLATNTNWGEYATAYEYTATDGGEWIIKAYKSAGMQINTGKSAYIKVPECAAKIIQISLTCNSSAKNAVKFAKTINGESIADGSSSTSQTLDLSGESVTTGYILPTGNCQITHIDVEYSGNVTYYTSSPVARYNVTYAKGDATGVTGLCEAQRHAAGTITLCDAPTCADKNFAKWSDGSNLYAAGAEYTLSADVTFTATWTPKPKYTVTYTANGGTGTAPAVEEYMEGEIVTVKENEYFSKPGFVYAGWQVVYNDGENDHIIIPNEDSEFPMPAYNVVIKAMWEEPSNQKWVRVDATEELVADGTTNYIIVGATSDVAMGALNGTYYNSVGIVKTGNYLNGPESMTKVTLEEGSASGKFAIKHGTKYIHSGSAKNIGEQNDASDWTITITNGVATIKTGTGDGWYLKYNSQNPRFNTYASGQQTVAIYREKALTPIDHDDMTEEDVNTYDDVEIAQDKTWTVSNDKEVGDVYMKEGAVIANSATVTANDLYFKARHGKSNQIFDLSKITVVSNMYYDFQLCDGDVDANYWYSISVPFDVDLNSGVFQVGGTTPLVNHSDFEVWEYDTQKRADTQSNGWKRSSDNMMHAGKAYLIGFNPGQPNIIRLKAAANWQTNLFSGSSLGVAESTGSGDHDNWNGLANPTGRYIDVNANAQVFNNNTHQFDPFTYDALAYNFVVGTAFFVQSASDITISNTDHGQYRAPKRAEAESSKCAYAVRITRAEAANFDNQIIVRASEDATSEYEQGHDMLTMNNATSKKAAMLWTKNYGGKRLAIEEAPFSGDKASYELGIYAPAAGEYAISVPAPKDNADLYLTKNGMIIWNLSMNECTLTLEKGNNDGFGLLLVKKAPQVSTGVESTEYGVQNSDIQKVIIDEHVYILREGQMYDVTGKMVK